jgi:Kef-type K+ transport system membrane component KefB
VYLPASLLAGFAQSFQQAPPVAVVGKDGLAAVSAIQDEVKGTRVRNRNRRGMRHLHRQRRVMSIVLTDPYSGADVMKRIATPMVGGVVTSTIIELIVYPAIFYIWRSRRLEQPTTAEA